MLSSCCLCGKVRYRVALDRLGVDQAPDQPSIDISHCHCITCQKSHAAAFATYTRVQKNKTTIDGAEYLSHFASSKHAIRSFCKQCGSHMQFTYHNQPDYLFLTVATLENLPLIQSARHIYTKSTVPWCPINDDLPQFLEYP